MKHSNVSYSEMCESVNFNTHQVSSEDSSSEYKVNIVGFRHIPCCLSKQFSDINDSFSIDQFITNSHIHPEVFKCFKCYGIVQNKQAQPINKCRQCQGTSFVTDSHPIVSILQQIISKEVPQLVIGQQNSKKRKLNRRQTIEKQYACPDTIKEESFSMQEDQVPSCKSCLKQCENNYYKCDRCPNYYVCPLCYSKDGFYHHHKLYAKEVSMMVDELNLCFNLKKISEQVQSLQVSNVVQQDLASICSSCKKQLQACFVCCTTCAVKGFQFNLCDQCYQNNSYQHESNHQLTIKTSIYDEQIDLNSFYNSSVDFQNNPLFESQENLSQKSKQPGLFNNSFVRFEDQIQQHGSQIIMKVNNSQRSIFQNQLEELAQMPNMKSKLSKSYRSEKVQQQQDFSIRFSQSRHEQQSKNISLKQIHEGPKIKSIIPNKQIQKQKNQNSKHSHNSHRDDKSQADRSNPQEYVFKDYRCDICGITPIISRKYHCNQCDDFDLCETCYIDQYSKHQHKNFTLEDGKELLKKQKMFLVKSIKQKSAQSRISLLHFSKRLVQSKSLKKRGT